MSHSGDCKGHCCSASGSSLRQTIDEMDFERGIWSAAQQNDLNRVEFLLSKGKPVDQVDLAGYTALHYAARNGNVSVCELLLDNGSYVGAITRSGLATALHRAASQGHVDIVHLLLRRKADPDVRDSDGFTPLHRAIKEKRILVCKILADKTDLGIVDSRGRTPRELAIEIGNEEIEKLIRDAEDRR